MSGMLATDEYRALLRRARVFVCAPRREDYGIAQLEALADGCLLVSTPAPGPYAALPIARELDRRLVGEDLRARSAHRAGRSAAAITRCARATALAPFSRVAVDRVVAEQLLPRLLDSSAFSPLRFTRILPVSYQPRVVDRELTARLSAVGAVVIEGPKGCGKTATARQIAASEVLFDVDANARQAIAVDPALVLDGQTPRLLDEWQIEPAIWNHVRRAIDDRSDPGQFILTGSAGPPDDITRHTGAGAHHPSADAADEPLRDGSQHRAYLAGGAAGGHGQPELRSRADCG